MANNLSRRADGRYVKKIKDARTGKDVYFYGKTERELNQKLLDYRSQMQIGRSFCEVAEAWWQEAEPQLASQSQKAYRPAMKRAVDALGDYNVKDIRPRHISALLRKLSREDLGAKSLAKVRMIVNLICKYAVLENDIEINPCTAVELPQASKRAARSAASPEDEARVKAAYKVWLLPYIALMTGMRKGEILALQWKDVDFEANVIHVTKSVYHVGDRPFIKEPKTEESVRPVPLLLPLRDVLLEHDNREPDDYIISDDGKKPMTNRRYITRYDQFRQETGIKCTAHQLRHSFATIAFECGVPLKSVQEILGHKQLSTTMDIYTDFRKKSVQTAAEILNKNLQ